MIKAIFFSKFDVNEGPKVLHQVPADSIVPSPNVTHPPLFHFPSVSNSIIPRKEFCSQLLTVVTNSYRVLGHPICLPSPSYPRNEFFFNFCLVLDAAANFSPHLTITLRLATLLRTLEEQDYFLSRDPSPPNTGKIYALCEILLEDLNNYGESMIPIDDANTLNVKLFPTYAPPPPLLPYHVPLSTVKLSTLVDQNWDLTMLLILPHINGVNSIRQIALLADADYKLVRKAISHLLYYNCIILLDIFSFAAIYAPTAELGTFVASLEMQNECARYVAIPDHHHQHHQQKHHNDRRNGSSSNPTTATTTTTHLVELYSALRQGQSVKSFCIDHSAALEGIDIRRLITFGVIKGFLYRVHKYAIATKNHPHRAGKGKAPPKKRLSGLGSGSGSGSGSIPAAGGGGRGGGRSSDDRDGSEEEAGGVKASAVAPYLDGTHCFDEICTELMVSERELVACLNEMGDVLIVHR